MKRIIAIVMTLLVLIGLSYGIAYFTHTTFIDYALFVGIAITGIIWFFSSKGGHTSRVLDAEIQGTTGLKTKEKKYEFSPNVAFYTSLAYTIIMLVALIYHYRSYF